MKGKYIVPVAGKVYANRSGGEYRCIRNTAYDSEAMEQRIVSHGEHTATFERVKDGDCMPMAFWSMRTGPSSGIIPPAATFPDKRRPLIIQHETDI